ncbi:hypothetical protein C8R44DRAFT_753081 [Mycena epipterygia]|nr:hypothetical protein C8R44DRAFT_753081 [Mycena epipterygia]
MYTWGSDESSDGSGGFAGRHLAWNPKLQILEAREALMGRLPSNSGLRRWPRKSMHLSSSGPRSRTGDSMVKDCDPEIIGKESHGGGARMSMSLQWRLGGSKIGCWPYLARCIRPSRTRSGKTAEDLVTKTSPGAALSMRLLIAAEIVQDARELFCSVPPGLRSGRERRDTVPLSGIVRTVFRALLSLGIFIENPMDV